MQPVIQRYPRIILAGFSFFGDPFHSHAGWTETNEIGRLWQRLLQYLGQQGSEQQYPSRSYEIHLQNHQTHQTGEFEVFVGFDIPNLDQVPVELCLKFLPEGEYAVFTLQGEAIQMDEPIIDRWLKDNGYTMASPLFVQRYDERFKGLDHLAESELDVLVPILRVGANDRP